MLEFRRREELGNVLDDEVEVEDDVVDDDEEEDEEAEDEVALGLVIVEELPVDDPVVVIFAEPLRKVIAKKLPARIITITATTANTVVTDAKGFFCFLLVQMNPSLIRDLTSENALYLAK
jgi:hypothetical protein